MYWASLQETFKGIKYFNCVSCKKMHIKHAEWLACSQISGATLSLTDQAAVDTWKPPVQEVTWHQNWGKPFWQSWISALGGGLGIPGEPTFTVRKQTAQRTNCQTSILPFLSHLERNLLCVEWKYFTIPLRRKNKEEWVAAIECASFNVILSNLNHYLRNPCVWEQTSGFHTKESCMKLYNTSIPWSHWTWFSLFKETSWWGKFWVKRKS